MSTKYRAFAIDLDGTLLVGEELPSANIESLRRARDMGIKVMIATARWTHIAQRIADQIGIRDLIIACSGAQVYDPSRQLDIFDHRLPEEFTKELFDLCNGERCIATVTFGADVRLKLDGEPDMTQMGDEMSWVRALNLDVDDPPRIAAIQGSACIARIRSELQEKFADQVNIFDSIGPSGKIIITITAKAATKGAALQAACEEMGITREQVVAFGDAENDLEMFKAAGAAVAMGQADETTKSHADYVTRANHEAGVGYAVDQILKGEILH
ncbi:MAG: Cof-type HAD-IIB family hydrolase [Pseudomonadales bacterium]|nr:Cof-type HAD-IIB family hydrolase [Pseudomonadales bacterium]